MAYKRTSKSVQQIARELGVDYILESSLRREGDEMRITVQLVRTRDQVHIWAHSYDRHISRSISLQEEVAEAVAEQIKIKLSPAYGGPSSVRPLDPQANEAYLRGRYFENQFTVVGFGKAIAYFQQAIDRDPSFGSLFGTGGLLSFPRVTEAMSTEVGEPKALDAAHHAVALGEGLAESHTALGSVLLGRGDWSQAESEFKRAIELNPSYSAGHRLYAALLVSLRRHNRTHFWLGRVYAQKGMYGEAIAESEKVLQAMPDSSVGLTELGYSLAAGDRQPEARRILRRLEEKSQRDFVPAYNLAVIHIALHEQDQALYYLQKAYVERDWAIVVFSVEPRLDPLRSNPRFQELVHKVGPQP